ncbi:MAG: DUF4272 domain-containing protein [Rubripirellula sp.]
MQSSSRLAYVLSLLALCVCGCSNDSAPSPTGPAWDPADEGKAAGVAASERQAGSQMAATTGKYPDPETWEAAGERQAERAARSFAILKQHDVPAYDGPLFVADDDVAKIQSAEDVAKRVLVLWAVELRAEGVSQEEAIGLIEKLDLWDSVSPVEKLFLQNADPDPEESKELVWRLESIWVLLWSLGYIDELEWPSGMCDVKKLVAILKPLESDPAFITGAKLRDKAELLDAQDLTMRIHWAVRDSFLNANQMVPKGLDWTNTESLVPIGISPAVGVVEQRHYVLNWLVRYLEPKDWDSVDTPT